ncbi:GTP cyclohydrolase II [Telmatospirillum siberiense]|uniref:GTP cyclohydrolase-2 n=1 Tax=Telmatospirillum siberiense TaxID=382514 RepID=A0A2N3PN14_9PROT|nr:GTP cyclohydrolase II [Telmatospirillum siberiense]PKU21789.1 GTP cyclohydrolase II [Telmatospirillum siberiense]
MSRSLIVKPVPLPQPPNALVAVDRAVAELRRGGLVQIDAEDGSSVLVLAAEATSAESLTRLTRLSGDSPRVILTGRRAHVLGLIEDVPQVAVVSGPDPLTPVQVAGLANPLGDLRLDPHLTVSADPIPAWAPGAVALAKLSRLLPAVVAAPTTGDHEGLFRVAAGDILAYRPIAARSLKRVAEARVPLADAEEARVVAFRPSDGGIEHLAIIVGHPDRDQPVLTRLHSECFTGDLLGSLRCDCGDQLRGAIALLAKTGGGVLLYLAQEGRGIGLVNKLRAYELQDAGFDTLDANQQLGFDDDERIYLPAAEMLRLLGIQHVRLLTNNPGKVEGLARHGVEVIERVPHVFPSNGHNAAYLHTKATRSGHLF